MFDWVLNDSLETSFWTLQYIWGIVKWKKFRKSDFCYIEPEDGENETIWFLLETTKKRNSSHVHNKRKQKYTVLHLLATQIKTGYRQEAKTLWVSLTKNKEFLPQGAYLLFPLDILSITVPPSGTSQPVHFEVACRNRNSKDLLTLCSVQNLTRRLVWHAILYCWCQIRILSKCQETKIFENIDFFWYNWTVSFYVMKVFMSCN